MGPLTLFGRSESPQCEEPISSQNRLTTPESRPMLIDILSSGDRSLVFTAMALSKNGAQVTSDETEETDATVHRITLPDGSAHERPVTMQRRYSIAPPFRRTAPRRPSLIA
jgi:hypothetical protein